jgi:hypothetical protein
MCWGIYIVADRPLPEVEDNPHFPEFAVREVEDERAEKVRRATGAEWAYYASSWQGCGCGFSYDSVAEHERHLAKAQGEPALEKLHRENRAAELASVGSLSRYARQAAADGPLAVYAVDERQVGREPSIRQLVTPSFFGGPEFSFGNGSAMFEPTGLYEMKASSPLHRAL